MQTSQQATQKGNNRETEAKVDKVKIPLGWLHLFEITYLFSIYLCKKLIKELWTIDLPTESISKMISSWEH